MGGKALKEKIKQLVTMFFAVVFYVVIVFGVMLLFTKGQGPVWEKINTIAELALHLLGIGVAGFFIFAILKGTYNSYKAFRYGTSKERIYVGAGGTLLFLSFLSSVTPSTRGMVSDTITFITINIFSFLMPPLGKIMETLQYLQRPIYWDKYKIVFGAVFTGAMFIGVFLIFGATMSYLESKEVRNVPSSK